MLNFIFGSPKLWFLSDLNTRLFFSIPSANVLYASVLASLKLLQASLKLSVDVRDILNIRSVKDNQFRWHFLKKFSPLFSDLIQIANEKDIEEWMMVQNYLWHALLFLFSGDLETAARLVSLEPSLKLDPKESLKELLLFSVSEPYFKLREMLGVTIPLNHWVKHDPIEYGLSLYVFLK